jgi:dTDP-D-glucose 4,6-dehydratase
VGDQAVYITDNSKIARATGWKPEIDLKKTIQLLQEFWEENHDVLTTHRRASSAAYSPFTLATQLSGRAG